MHAHVHVRERERALWASLSGPEMLTCTVFSHMWAYKGRSSSGVSGAAAEEEAEPADGPFEFICDQRTFSHHRVHPEAAGSF